MINIIKEEIEIEEALLSRIKIICDFCNTKPEIINGSIRKIEHTNLSYIEPHRIIIKNKLYLAFNYSNEIYINNLGKKMKLSKLDEKEEEVSLLKTKIEQLKDKIEYWKEKFEKIIDYIRNKVKGIFEDKDKEKYEDITSVLLMHLKI